MFKAGRFLQLGIKIEEIVEMFALPAQIGKKNVAMDFFLRTPAAFAYFFSRIRRRIAPHS